MSTEKKLEDLNLSNDEIRRLGEAFKQEEFRKLFAEYAEEISNPENRAKYEADIRQMEGERGMDVKFINPDPGYVIKTTIDGQRKVFINVCKNENIGKPVSQKKVGENGLQGLAWSIPHSFTPPRDDLVKGAGARCTVFDFVVHPDTLRMAETNSRFKKLVNEMAVEGIQRQFDAKIDAKNLKFPKMKYKGKPTSTVIRSHLKDAEPLKERDPDDIMNRFPYPYDSESTEEKARKHEAEMARKRAEQQKKQEKTKLLSSTAGQLTESEYTTPKYVIKHRSELDMQDFVNSPTDAKEINRPTTLIVEIDLPLLSSAAPVNLDIFERKLILVSQEPAKYKLELSLPYPVNENEGSARFDKAKRHLVVTLPVIPAIATKLPFMGESFDDIPVPSAENAASGPVLGLLEQQSFVVVDSEANSERSTSKPLIEVLSSSDNSSTLSNDRSAVTLSPETQLHDNSMRPSEPAIPLLQPEFISRQDNKTVSFVVDVSNAKGGMSSAKLLGDNLVQVRIVSVGDGGFPVHYGFMVKFDNDCLADGCSIDCSPENVVVVISKQESAYGIWNSYQVGASEETLTLKHFEMVSNLMNDLDKLDASVAAANASRHSRASKKRLAKIDVTQMDTKKLVLNVKRENELNTASDDQDDIDSTEIIVVHEKESPKLQGILKQRSVSESSDSLDRQVSTVTTGSDDLESESGSEGHSRGENMMRSDSQSGSSSSGSGSIKKSVSFNDRVDRTMFAANQTVSAMHAALRSKRRRMRKNEQRNSLSETQDGQGGRRRRSSGSLSLDSGDDPFPATVTLSKTGKKGKKKSAKECPSGSTAASFEPAKIIADGIKEPVEALHFPEDSHLVIVSEPIKGIASDNVVGTTKLAVVENSLGTCSESAVDLDSNAVAASAPFSASELMVVMDNGDLGFGDVKLGERDANCGNGGGRELQCGVDVAVEGAGDESEIGNVLGDSEGGECGKFVVGGYSKGNSSDEIDNECKSGFNEPSSTEAKNSFDSHSLESGTNQLCEGTRLPSSVAEEKNISGGEVSTNPPVFVSRNAQNVSKKSAAINEPASPPHPDTMLSWKDEPCHVASNKKVSAAFEFTNSVMFDLDVE